MANLKLDEPTQRAASAHALRDGLQFMDLLPGDMPALAAMGVVQVLDPNSYRHDRLARGHTSGYAMLASEELLHKAGVGETTVSDAVSFVRLGPILKKYASDCSDLAIAPALQASPDNHFNDWLVFSVALAGMGHSMFMLRAILLIIILAGLFLAPVAAAVAIATFHCQVLLAFAGNKLHPRDLLRSFILRTPMEILAWFQMLRTRLQMAKPEVDPIEARRPFYEAMLFKGSDLWFEPRRRECPLCGSTGLKRWLKTADIIQGKPGRFTLERCRDCGHVFQNPQLTPAGMDFYYADFYDGLGAGASEAMFRSRPRLYEERAALVRNLATPKRWLDVGTGHGHFCCAAKKVWPDTYFDGLDIGDGIDQAVKAGWVDRGYRGFLPDVASQIAGEYDVVSLFHCLEHTLDPWAELRAAHTCLAPGGLLVIELPNPECVIGRLLGGFWLPWFQPQHVHLFSLGNLQKLLVQEGFEPTVSQVREAHLRLDLFSGLMMFYGWLAPKPYLPWRPRPTWFSRLRYFVVWNLGFPPLFLAWLLDFAVCPLMRSMGVSNTFRVVARQTVRKGETAELSSGHTLVGPGGES
jgi:SAM-dependent methyltransferase